jgi:23S rRNA (cytosine1962-C5)-methyltransferase
MRAQRYQLRKDAVAIFERGHPWIFRDQMSTAAGALADGQWLRLVDGTNRVVGYGIYESDGAIAIRSLRVGPAAPDAEWLRTTLRIAVAKRAPLAARTDGIRLVHGESDGIPAVVVDRFGDTIVVASYSAGADAIARYVARALGVHIVRNADDTVRAADNTVRATDDIVRASDDTLRAVIGPARHIVLRPARRRRGPVVAARVVRGSPADVVWLTEDGIRYAVDLAEGHKTGTYLDLRGLRQALQTAPLTGARVLDLFSYTGMLGRAAEAAGAASIVHVDQSQRALDLAAAHHVVDRDKHRFMTADIFDWLPALDASEQFDVVIVDPPAMTSRKAQVPSVLAAYRKLYRAVESHVRPGGLLISACCTSRIERGVFRKTVRDALPARFTLERDLPPELDHPVGFTQADYLKILLWRAAS